MHGAEQKQQEPDGSRCASDNDPEETAIETPGATGGIIGAVRVCESDRAGVH